MGEDLTKLTYEELYALYRESELNQSQVVRRINRDNIIAEIERRRGVKED